LRATSRIEIASGPLAAEMATAASKTVRRNESVLVEAIT